MRRSYPASCFFTPRDLGKSSHVEWLTNPASSHGVAMRTDWYVFLGAGIFVGVFVYACIFWCLVAYRRRSDAQPEQFSGNPPLEAALRRHPTFDGGRTLWRDVGDRDGGRPRRRRFAATASPSRRFAGRGASNIPMVRRTVGYSGDAANTLSAARRANGDRPSLG